VNPLHLIRVSLRCRRNKQGGVGKEKKKGEIVLRRWLEGDAIF